MKNATKKVISKLKLICIEKRIYFVLEGNHPLAILVFVCFCFPHINQVRELETFLFCLYAQESNLIHVALFLYFFKFNLHQVREKHPLADLELIIVQLCPSPSQKNKTLVLDQSRTLKSPSK
jgi:hypothetical protein